MLASRDVPAVHDGNIDYVSFIPFPTQQMLVDRGVSPGSVSEQRAASVFDDVVRNGRPDPGACLSRLQQQPGRRNTVVDGTGDGGEAFMEVGGRGWGPSTSRKPRGDRLCWSLFLETMVGSTTKDDNLVYPNLITRRGVATTVP